MFNVTLYTSISLKHYSVGHGQILQKLSKYGVRDKILLWFQDYLSRRTQRVLVMAACASPWWSLVVTWSLAFFKVVFQLVRCCLFCSSMTCLMRFDPDDANIALYADDTEAIQKITSESDAHNLHSCIWILEASATK